MKRLKKCKFIGDKGSSLVMALVTVSFIAVLGMTIITMALSAYKIKAMEGKSKKAYYNADMAVDEIYAGLCGASYLELSNAYEYVISNLLEVEGGSITMIDNTQANALLRKTYFEKACYSIFRDSFAFVEEATVKTAIDNALTYGGEITNIDKTKLADALKSYLSENYKDTSGDILLNVQVFGAPYVMLLDGKVQSVTIKDVVVTYQNVKTDYFSQITTDYEIVFPENAVIDIVEDTSDILLSFRDYSLVSNRTVNSSNYITVNGGVYGYQGINCVGSAAAVTSVKLAITGGNLVTGGDVVLQDHAALDFNNGRIWADNLELKGADLVIGDSAAAYIADDLTLNSPDTGTLNNSVTISGDYYGYSIEGHGISAGEATPAKSSAMIINSKNSTLNFSNIRTLVLGGYGWVEYDRSAGGYYRTGESIAIRYTQTAYILPSPWNGSIDVNFFGRNLLGSPQVIENKISEGNTEYYYNFSSGDNAAKFYRALYDDELFYSLCAEITGIDMTEAAVIRNSIREILDETYDKFLTDSGAGVPAVQINPNARVYEKGIIRDNTSGVNEYNGVGDELVKMLYANSVWRDKIIGSLLIELEDDWIYDAAEWTPVTLHAPINYGSMRFSYKIKSEEELNRGAVENIVLGKSKITGNYYYYPEDAAGNNASDYMVYVANGDVDLYSLGCRKGIVIATGDVRANADFEGCILAFGKIDVTGGNYTANPILVETILKTLPGVRGYFDGVSDVTVGQHIGYNDATPTTVAGSEESGNLNHYGASDCVNIANYRKNAALPEEDSED